MKKVSLTDSKRMLSPVLQGILLDLTIGQKRLLFGGMVPLVGSHSGYELPALQC